MTTPDLRRGAHWWGNGGSHLGACPKCGDILYRISYMKRNTAVRLKQHAYCVGCGRFFKLVVLELTPEVIT